LAKYKKLEKEDQKNAKEVRPQAIQMKEPKRERRALSENEYE